MCEPAEENEWFEVELEALKSKDKGINAATTQTLSRLFSSRDVEQSKGVLGDGMAASGALASCVSE